MIALLLTMFAAAVQPQASDLDRALAVLDVIESSSISVDYQQEPLAFIVDDLGERIGVPVRADWSSLERLGAMPETRLSLRFTSTRAATVLASLTLSLGDELERPVLESHAGQMILTRVAATSAMRLTAVYDVRDVLSDDALVNRLRAELPPIEPPSQDQPTPHAAPETAPQSAVPVEPDKPVQSDPLLPPMDTDSAVVKPLTPAEKLLLLITDHVDPEAWMNFGGNRALISETNGVLVVSATPTTHRKIRESLRLLRATQTAAITVEATLIDLPRSQMESLSRRFRKDTSAMAAAMLAEKDSVILWRSAAPVAEGHTLDTESTANDVAIQLVIAPTLDRTTGLLDIRCEARTNLNRDQRRVATTLRLPSDTHAAWFELPAASPASTMRCVVLSIRR